MPAIAVRDPAPGMTDPSSVLERIIDAHGGRGLWERLHSLEVQLSARGALFTLKRRRPLRHVTVTAMAREPRFLFHDFPSPGLTGELIGEEEVRILGSAGRVVERRANPRATLLGPGKFFAWDDLDFIYFGGYATWNYLVTPFLFLHEGVTVEPVPLRPGMPSGWTGLRAHFPAAIPTHCPTQLFFFDERHHLRRFEYVAEVVGGWAHAAHLCEDYRNFAGYKAPVRRRVRPMLPGNLTLPGPTLVAIDIHHLRPEFAP